jgi:hypothetical protein
MGERREHWERVNQTKCSEETSWYEMEPSISLRLLDAAGLRTGS